MEKTAKKWFEELNEPYRSQAIESINNDLFDEIDDVNLVYDSLEDALYGAFTWDKTTQGSDYWINLKNSL
jgi:hypothetical protein